LFAIGGAMGSLAPKVHPVVKDADDLDEAIRPCAVHEEVTPTPAMPRNVERAKTGDDLVAGVRAWNIGTVGKLADRLNERVPIRARLSDAKILGGPSEDVREVEFGLRAEADTPAPLGRGLYSADREATLSERSFR